MSTSSNHIVEAVDEILNTKIREIVVKLSAQDIRDLFSAGIRTSLPLSAASYYAVAYKYLDIAFNHLSEIDRRRDKQLRDVHRKFRDLKRMILEDIIKKSSIKNYDFNIIKKDLENISLALGSAEYRVIKIKFTTIKRAIVGSPPLPFQILFESGTTIHRLYQTPYIPGSSLKGSLRSYLELLDISCKVDSLVYDVNLLMGNKEIAGQIVFSDAIPIGASNSWRTLLEPEVTTPIYADGTDSPRVKEHLAKPNPVIYPVIARYVVFYSLIGINKNIPEECAKAFNIWLRETLLMGLGRKTSLSYGMSKVLDISEDW